MEKNHLSPKTAPNEITISKTRKILSVIFPDKIIIKLKNLKNIIKYIDLSFHDGRQYIKAMNKRTDDKLLHTAVINTHIIEKGLSHDNIRLNFGKNALTCLSESLNEFSQRGLTSTDEYGYAISTLASYILIHEKEGGNKPEIISSLFNDDILKAVESQSNYSDNLQIGGAFYIDKESKKDNNKKNFEELAKNRYTIRSFVDEKVDVDLVKKAIEIAKKSPSACNRQSARVAVIENKELIKSILDIQAGFRGYNLPSVLLINMVDLSAYSSYTDRHMGYVDSGLFTMSVVYGLEFVGLGACLLNASFDKTKEKKIRKLINLKNNYQFTSLIAIGVAPEKIKVAKSHRLDENEIMRIIR